MADKKRKDEHKAEKKSPDDEQKHQDLDAGSPDTGTTGEETGEKIPDKPDGVSEQSEQQPVTPDQVIPQEFLDPDDQKKESRRISSISAFALILAIFVFIMVIKIYPNLNPNQEHFSEMIAKYESKIDQIDIEIRRLENETSKEKSEMEIHNVKGLVSSLQTLKHSRSKDIADLASKIQQDIQALIFLVENQQKDIQPNNDD